MALRADSITTPKARGRRQPSALINTFPLKLFPSRSDAALSSLHLGLVEVPLVLREVVLNACFCFPGKASTLINIAESVTAA